MKERDRKFASWTISLSSIMYGLISSILIYQSNFYGQRIDGLYRYFYYTPLIFLILFGITKIFGILSRRGIVKRISIVGMMFSWGFLWTADLVSFILNGPNRGTILIIPILAICIYVAMRGDYSD